MANKKSVNLLPEYLQTDKNKKFLSSTIDQLIQTPELERIDGYIGSKDTPNYDSTKDIYINENFPLRKNYQLEPALVFRNSLSTPTDVIGFDDIINELQIQGSHVDNLDKLFRTKFYSYNPHIEWDKLINYSQYYWLPNGPSSIVIDDSINVESVIVGQESYTMSNGYALTNGLKLYFTNNVSPAGYRGKEYIVEGVGTAIKLIDFSKLEASESLSTVYNETFDTNLFDTYPFDGNKKLPLTPEYITINRSSNDLNSWSRYNRWFHSDVIRITAEINNEVPVYTLTNKAQRPIVEFRPNLQLYKFGKVGIRNIDLIDETTKDAFNTVDGSAGYYVDQVLLEVGNRVVFNADQNENVRGKIYLVTLDTVGTDKVIRLVEDTIPNDLDSISVNYGATNAGKNWYFNSATSSWNLAQQHTYLNQPPLFDLFDSNGVSYTTTADINNFAGTQIFGYDIGTGTADTVLGFPLKYQNSVGVGSYLFKNYFMTDSIVSTVDYRSATISTGITYLKLNEEATSLVNVWTLAEDFPMSVNADGAYDTPLSLTNNPLNGPISDFTLSELSDHLSTMIARSTEFAGVFPGVSNLRDLTDYQKYGTRLIINENPIAFAQTFLGKKEHNLVDATRLVADHYAQYKMTLMKFLLEVDDQTAPSVALDLILNEINKSKDDRSPYFRSDMVPYGADVVLRNYTVSNINTSEYPIGVDFDLSTLSFSAVLVYANNLQLVYGVDYSFNKLDGTIVLIKPRTLGDKLKIVYYQNTKGSFVPPTPSKLGLYPKFVPEIYQDDSYVDGPVTMIKGHDGSVMKAYGDYRDAIILEFEQRIYNNIKIEYDSSVFDINAVMPSVFRTKYSVEQANSILQKDFIRWSGAYNVDVTTNVSFDPGNPWTWNYKGAYVNNVYFSLGVSGTWRNVYKQFYDTDRPHTHPWEMLGFGNKPVWWEDAYGPAPYLPANNMWLDLELGLDVNRNLILDNYARPGLSSILPVDSNGDLLAPNEFLVSENAYLDKKSNWIFGDQGPAETAWRRSSYWPFVINALAALLEPCNYSSAMYDLSRTARNQLGQLTYLEDDLYLNPSKLLVEGINDIQISGFGTFVYEAGKRKNNYYLDQLTQDLAYLNFNLFHKLGGFTSKDKLQVVIDSIDPVSTSQGAILPPEDYDLILNVSNPIKSAAISGIIIQKSNGKFVIKGYDKTNPYFDILKPIKTASAGAVSVGGKSESFTEWSSVTNNGNRGLSSIELVSAESNTTRYYKQGQIVRYNGKYYRVKIGHNAQPTFDPTLFQQLAGLPMTGGATAQKPARFETTVTSVPYGTEFTTTQEVYDLMVGYGAYLESQGFVFDKFNTDLNEMIDWSYSAKEFLYWTTQNWADNNLITLSPFADSLKYQFTDSTVDSITSSKYEYTLLKADGKSFPIDKFNLTRDDGVCTINVHNTEEGIFFAVLNSVQKEHGMIFNNSTIFNDTIYDIETGYRQQRMKLSGFRTANWNGDLYNPGFIYDSVDISDWAAYSIYLPGKVVRYNGAYYESNQKVNADPTFDFTKWVKLVDKPIPDLLPNFDYKISQFEDFYSLDIDNFDSSQQQLAQHLIGYTPRPYLNNIFTNPITQYKFYQGFIKEKGTRNSLDKISKAGAFARQGSIELTEEWAFRVGHYGGFETYREIEFPLEEGTFLENPYVVKLVDGVVANPNPLINYTSSTNLLLSPKNFNPSTAFETVAGDFDNNAIELTTAGYVRTDDITVTAYNKNSLLDIANNALIKESDTVWLGFLENGGWTVYRYSKQSAKVAGVFVSSPGANITFVTDRHHNLSPGDIISIVRFNSQVNGVYIVESVPKLNQVTVASELTSINNEDLLAYGALFKFEEVRYANFEELSKVPDLLKLNENEKVWIDEDENLKWAVYEKVKNYGTGTNFGSGDLPAGQRLGYKVYATEGSPVTMAAAPGWSAASTPSFGRVSVYSNKNNVLEKKFEYSLNNSTTLYAQANTVTNFGLSLEYDIGKGLYFAAAPEASEIRAPYTYGGVVLSTGTGTAKTFVSEGVLKISRENIRFAAEQTVAVLVSPYATTTATASYSKFGYSLYINKVASDQPTLLLVAAPGDGVRHTGVGNVFAYNLTTATNTSTVTIVVDPGGPTLTSSLTLPARARFGNRLDGNDTGDIIAVGIPGYRSNGLVGAVEIFNRVGNTFTSVQTLMSPYGTRDEFPSKLKVSSSGKYLIVGSSSVKFAGKLEGKVAIYQLINGQYQLHQILDNPQLVGDLNFGQSINISSDETTLIISALGKNRSKVIKFDSDIVNTTFDGGTTRFLTPIPDSGTVYVYNNLGGWFVLSDELTDTNILPGSRYGNSVALTNNSVFIGAPSYASSGLASVARSNTSTITASVYENLYVRFSAPDSIPGVSPVVEVLTEPVSATEKAVVGFKITSPGSGYKRTPVARLEDSCGETLDTLIVRLEPDNSCFYQFTKLDTATGSWKRTREQDALVDVTTVKRVALIDSLDEEIVEYLDIFDPLKGKVPGLAEQELKFKSAFDPATYSMGTAATINDANTSWIDDHVGELWWDLSTAKYVWYEQGDEVYRKNNWGKLFPGATIDVYEWVKSDLLPSEWAAQADTNEGLTKGISGQPKYPDNSVLSVKQLFNTVTNSFENVYYFWVKNKVLTPSVKNRRISSYEVSRLIADPTANGLKFAEILSSSAIAFANVQPSLNGNRINANIITDVINNEIPRHTEWLLLKESAAESTPNELLEKKLIDSLLGHDPDGNLVPDPTLSSRGKYGIGIRPQQSLFKDRIEALRNLIDFTNSVLLQNRITGNYSFENLNNVEDIPDELSGEYDIIVDDQIELGLVDTDSFSRAELQCFVQDGKIRSVNVINSGFGYTLPPKVLINTSVKSNAEIKTEIDNLGRVVNAIIVDAGEKFVNAPVLEVRAHSIVVRSNPEYNGRWSLHSYDYLNQEWIKSRTQSYNTPLYWNYVDWVADNFDQYKDYSYVIDNTYQLASITDISVGEYVKINNIGDGRYIILERIDNSSFGNFSTSYNIVYSQHGTIQILDTIWDYSAANYSFDDATLEETLYDQIPDSELYYILTALKDNIFIKDLRINWNLFFFKAVKYALTEQKLLDWAFKTSFINVTNVLGTLDQRSVYKLDNEEYFESYVKEIKPYHSKIRTYTSRYDSLETANINVTDFDLPSYFNTLTQQFETVTLGTDLVDQYPWKSWKDNYTYELTGIEIGNPGNGYTQTPTVSITTATGDVGYGASADAYIKNGKLYKVLITNPGTGYVIPPIVTIEGGGPFVTTTATVSPVINNSTVRKNIVGIKFDRVSVNQELSDQQWTDTFECTGDTAEFVLTWLADPDKLEIIPLLDGKLVLSADYKIQYYSEEYNGYQKKYSKFVFLRTVPAQGQSFKITYKKNINLYTAVDRINWLYNPTDEMPGNELPLLMSGAEYPGTVVQGLSFDYSPGYGYGGYNGDSAWSDLINYYAASRLAASASLGENVLYLNTVTGVVPGQLINILNSSTQRVRIDTVVESVNTAANSITISAPSYGIKKIDVTGTAPGSTMTIKTRTAFNGTISVGDIIQLTGVTTPSYNDFYTVSSILDTTRFTVEVTSALTTTTAGVTTSSYATISPILTTIDAGTIFIKTLSEDYFSTSSSRLELGFHAIDITYVDVKKNGSLIPEADPLSPPEADYYHLTQDSVGNGVIAVELQAAQDYTIEVDVYSSPVIEFWKNDTDASGLDSSISAGSWNSEGFLGAQGINPEDLTIDGAEFLNIDSGYAPEECVAGTVIDSVGINVFTKNQQSYALVLTGGRGAIAGQVTEFEVGYAIEDAAGILVHNGTQIFDRMSSSAFTENNQFWISGNTVVVAPQEADSRIGYTIIGVGGDSLIDNSMMIVEDQTEAILYSLGSIYDVRQVYVLVDGQPINEITTTTSYGYMVAPVGVDNNRACVKFYNIPSGSHTLQAWFFNTPYDTFNRVHEETFQVTSSTDVAFALTIPTGNVEPVSAQVIVEAGSVDNPTQRRRLSPPWVSYYQIENDETVFDIENRDHSTSTYTIDTVKVYANGEPLISGFDYQINGGTSQITLTPGLLTNGDVLAIMSLVDYEYLVTGNLLTIPESVAVDMVGADVRVITFANNDNMLMRTERFKGSTTRRFTLSRPALTENYVWVYVDGQPITARYDYDILDDLKTVQINEWVHLTPDSDIVITTVDQPYHGSQIVGYRVFKDMFGRSHYKRIADAYSTTLEKELNYYDTEIHVVDASKLVPPNPAINKPGVVLIDGERIEFFKREVNVLSQLRRGTFGTAPADFSEAGTKVIDQSLQQTIPYRDVIKTQTTLTNSTTYIISTASNSVIGDGIVLSTDIDAADQIMVYYGGRQLRKSSLVIHNLDLAYDTTATSTTVLEPEFTINTSTRELRLNIADGIVAGTQIKLVKLEATVWTGTESILTSDSIQAQFLRDKPTTLPDSYFYGGDPVLVENNNTPLTNDSEEPLEGY